MLFTPRYQQLLRRQREQSLFCKNADGINIPVTPDVSGGFRLAFWWRPSTIAQDHALFNWESTFDRNGIALRQNNGGALAVVGSNAGGVVFVLTNGSNEVPGVPIFITLVYNSAKQISIRKNGTQILSGSGTITTNATTPYLGRRSHSNSMHALGMFKNFTFQNIGTGWTAAEIDDLMKRNITKSGDLQWQFNNSLLDKNGANRLTLQRANFTNDVPGVFM